MKKILFVGIFFILLDFICQAQSVYSKQNLEKATQEDLNLYLQKAKKTRTTGAVLSITGPIMGVTGGILMNNNFDFYSDVNESLLGTGVVLVITGISATIVGLPLLINGSSRVKRIKEIKNTAFNGLKMDLTPCNFYDFQTHNQQYGITFRVSF